MYDLVTGGVGQQWDCALLVCFMSVKDCVMIMDLCSGLLAFWAGWLVRVGGGWVALHISQSINARSVLLMVDGWETGTERRRAGTDWSKTLWVSWCSFTWMGTYLSGTQEKWKSR
jgi:hypothetical protein